MITGSLIHGVIFLALMASQEMNGTATKVDPLERAANHPIVRDRPGPMFLEGALGNGGLGLW